MNSIYRRKLKYNIIAYLYNKNKIKLNINYLLCYKSKINLKLYFYPK